MPETAIAGYQCYLIIERQFLGQCPLKTDLILEGSTIVRMNGVMYVDPALVGTDYESFADLVATYLNVPPVQGLVSSWVVDRATGEARYYDGTQVGAPSDPDIFWPAEKRGMGFVFSFKARIQRNVQELPEMGSMDPVALKATRHGYTLDLNKIWIDTAKLTSPDIDQPFDNQFSMRGEGLVRVNEYITSLRQNYHLVILYAKDMSGSNENKIWVIPCVKFDKVEIDSETGSIVNASLSGKATYIMHLPDDGTNEFEYENVFTEAP